MKLDLQVACENSNLPSLAQFEQWAQLAVENHSAATEITIRVVEPAESQALNLQYRGQDKATNVLSFPFQQPEFEDPEIAAAMAQELGDADYLGDLVINASLVAEEAAQQGKSTQHHWAHLVIHGTLHLQGYDHIDDDEAELMESLETQLLAQLDIANPYVAKTHD
ncbi:MAG TPA: rRNA maturation RNase YbeY [Oceanospirillaceae bacterium]|nr:rRNA maturation RNase YbeY [Oceanospirillaceae bacterium]